MVTAAAVLCAVLIGYLASPVAAGSLGVGDRRGPRIYPETLHTALYALGYLATHDDTPRVSAHAPPRPWWYDFTERH